MSKEHSRGTEVLKLGLGDLFYLVAYANKGESELAFWVTHESSGLADEAENYDVQKISPEDAAALSAMVSAKRQ